VALSHAARPCVDARLHACVCERENRRERVR
jgi:hypothetical protein